MGFEENKKYLFWIVAFVLLIPIGFLNIYCAIFYGILIVILFLNRKKLNPTKPLSVPVWIWIVIGMTSLFMIFIDITIVLFASGLILLISSQYLYKKQAISRRIYISSIMSVLLITVLGIFILDIPSRAIHTADFSDTRSARVTYFKYKRAELNSYSNIYREYRNDIVYKSLTYYGVHTSENNTSNEVAFTLHMDHNRYLTENTEFWRIHTDILLITLNDYSRQYLDTGLKSYALLDKLYTLEDSASRHHLVFKHEDYDVYSITFSANLPQDSSYLIAIDITIEPEIEYNYELYDEKKPVSNFEASCNFKFEDSLSGSLTEGWSWNYANIEPVVEAESLFSEFVSDDQLNLVGVFLLVYFVSIVIAFVQRNMNVLFIIQVLIYCLMILAVFAIIANSMENPPSWITRWPFTEKNGKYLWGIIQGVKSGIIFGVIGIIMGNLTQFITSSVGMLFQQGGISEMIKANVDGNPKIKKKPIRFSNNLDIDKLSKGRGSNS